MSTPGIHIIVVAAGTGSRFGAAIPKQFCLLGGRPVVMHTLERLTAACPDAAITLVISREMADFWQELCRQYGFASPRTVFGGASRWESVRNALLHPESPNEGITLVHDAARPLVDAEALRRLITPLLGPDAPDGVVPVMPVADSLRRACPDGSTEAVDRSQFMAVQTPQAFPTDKLRRAYELPYRDTFTDDASVMEAYGRGRIATVEGHADTFKITRRIDLDLAEILLGNSRQ